MRLKLLSLLALITVQVSAQNIELVSDSLLFGNATELTAATADFTVYNPSIYPIEVTDIDLFEIYGDAPFTSMDTAFIIIPKDSHTVTVTFLPEHNILHDMALVIKTKSGFGHKAVQLMGQGKYSIGYYSTTENQSEQNLKNALNARLAQGYNQLSYNVARDNMYANIDNISTLVECVYTGRTAMFSTRSGANANSFNTEHTFPQGFFSQALPMRSDIHHLFPTDVSANSTRSNNPFGLVSNPSWQQGGSKSNGSTFEPRDVHKGTCARAMMYFVIRYQDYSNHFAPQETTLRNWHKQYPPSQRDKTRNIAINAVQGNRNPFVDYPQFEERITNFVSTSVAPNKHSLYRSDDTIRLAQGASGVQHYDYVFYNTGNVDVTLNNFVFSNSDFNLAAGSPSSYTLAPGESKTIEISFIASNSYQGEAMTFVTDLPGQTNQTVYIESGNNFSIKEAHSLNWRVYPNPAVDLITVDLENTGNFELRLTDLTGRKIKTISNERTLDVSKITSGVYLLTILTDDGRQASQKVEVR